MKLYTFDQYCKERFGEKLYKLSLDGGFSCPNRLSRTEGGCAFCAGGSGAFTSAGTMEEQLAREKERIAAKFKGNRYIAYFQAYTGTYAPVERLRALYRVPLERPEIAALDIATRPDCLPPPVLALLKEIAAVKPLFIELGLQTADDRTAEAFGRGYPTACFDRAVTALRTIPGIHIAAHLMIGLPGEGKEALIRSVEHLNRTGVDGVKFHLLHILRGTRYEALYREGTVKALSFEEYAALLCAALRALKPGTVVHRITGDGPKADLIAPLWSGDKKRVLNDLHAIIEKL